MNKVILSGYISTDIKYVELGDGKKVVNFDLAVKRDVPVNGIDTDFIKIVAWNNLAVRFNNEAAKGSRISIVGRLQVRSYESQKGKQRVTEVVVAEIDYIVRKSA